VISVALRPLVGPERGSIAGCKQGIKRLSLRETPLLLSSPLPAMELFVPSGNPSGERVRVGVEKTSISVVDP
jgi:hypothetical protein